MSETDTKTQSQKPKTSKLAIWSMVLAIGGPLTGVALLATLLLTSWLDWLDNWISVIDCAIILCFGGAWILGLIMGVWALRKIKESCGLLKGRGLAIGGVVTSGAGLILPCSLFIMGRFIIPYPMPPTPGMVCGTNLSGLGKALHIYASDYDDQYPTAEKWCDLLVAYLEVSPKQLVCKGSDAKIGESSYAFNANLVGKKVTEVPPDIVVLFETNLGKNPAGRQALLAERDWHEFLEYPDSGKKVYKLRWNQFGGLEILTIENHNGQGCFILFNDGSVKFVKPERLGKLKWEVEEGEK